MTADATNHVSLLTALDGCLCAGGDDMMQIALNLAQNALDNGEVPVGCVFVHDDYGIIGFASNETNKSKNPTRHAEMIAIDAILLKFDKTVFSKTSLFVTCEPCVMCASALLQLDLKNVFYGCRNDKFGGCGSVLNIFSGVGQIREKEAINLLRKFYNLENKNAPEKKRKK